MAKQEIWLMMVMMFMGLIFSVIIQGLFNLGERVDEINSNIERIQFCLEYEVLPCPEPNS